MTVSASTPRIRATQSLFVLLLLIVALSGGRTLQGLAGLAAQAGGFMLVVAGTLWRMWASVFIAGRKDVEVVSAGPYARSRHPLYTGSLAAGLGLALTTRSLVLCAALPALLLALYGWAVRQEERFLAARHGDAWLRYRAAVPALWPRFVPVATPDRGSVDLLLYRKAFLDAATVLGLWGLIVLLDALQRLAAWQPLFALP